MPGQACIFKAFRASFTLLAARYVAPADAEGGRDFPLRQRNRSAKAVPQTNDFRLPPGEALIHQLPQA